MLNLRKNFTKIELFILAALIFSTFTAIETKAETMFVANFDGAQNVPSNNSMGKGFGVIVLNDAENEIHFIAEYSGLSSNNTAGLIKFGAAGQNSIKTIAIISFASFPATSNMAFERVQKITPEEAQQLRNGLWHFSISSVNFPNGELRGQILPYSPFVASLSGAQVVPPTNTNAGGRALLALNKSGTQAAIFYGHQNVSATNVAGFVDAGLPGTNGVAQFAFIADADSSEPFTLGFLRPPQVGLTPAESSALRAGRLYLRVVNQDNQKSAGEIRGQIKPLNKFADFDGDNRADISVFRPATGVWYWLDSSNNQFKGVHWGVANDDTRLPSDFDGDGLADLCVWRQSDATFYVLRSSDGTSRIQHWGQSQPVLDKPRPADYDGDGKSDFAIYRKGATASEQSYFYILESNAGGVRIIPWGLGSDFSMTGDFDGDRLADLTVVRNVGGQFAYYTRQSSDGALNLQVWGAPSQHYAMSGDFDGDGKSDPVAFTFAGANAGFWWVLGSSTGVSVTKWGNNNDDDFDPADYDGDGKADFAVYRDDNVFYILRSTSNSLYTIRFGTGGDLPITRFPF